MSLLKSILEKAEVEEVYIYTNISAETRDRTGDLQIFSLTLSQLSYRGSDGWLLCLQALSVAREEPNQLQHSHIGSHDLVNNQANFLSCERASEWTTEQRVDKMLQRPHSSVVDAF